MTRNYDFYVSRKCLHRLLCTEKSEGKTYQKDKWISHKPYDRKLHSFIFTTSNGENDFSLRLSTQQKSWTEIPLNSGIRLAILSHRISNVSHVCECALRARVCCLSVLELPNTSALAVSYRHLVWVVFLIIYIWLIYI